MTKWYGHVDYYDRYIIGQWFALDAETGVELWSRRFFRPTTVHGVAHDVIVASEMRSDGPWTYTFGIYGINPKSGKLSWCSHAGGVWGWLLRCLDYVPAFTNDLRDVPKAIVDRYVLTERGRVLDVVTGRDCLGIEIEIPSTNDESAPDRKLYNGKRLRVGDDLIIVERHSDFAIVRRDSSGHDVWRFDVKEHSRHVDGGYFDYRYHEGFILMILGDSPKSVPIDETKPMVHRSNPANYQMGVLDVASGEFKLFELINATQRKECRIEAIRGSRILVSCDGTQLTEYEIHI